MHIGISTFLKSATVFTLRTTFPCFDQIEIYQGDSKSRLEACTAFLKLCSSPSKLGKLHPNFMIAPDYTWYCKIEIKVLKRPNPLDLSWIG
jgi:hypothetical protein